MSLVDDALALAERFPVFASTANKRPITPHGHLDATQDRDKVRAMFSLPAARLISIPTGAVTGISVLDVDSGKHVEAAAWLQAHEWRIPETRVHKSQSGGRHYFFLHRLGLRTSQKIGPFVESRAERSSITVPPSPGYEVLSDAPMVAWPDWLLPPEPAPLPSGEAIEFRSLKAARSAIEGICKCIAGAAEGTRNGKLFWGCCRLRDAASQGLLTRGDAISLARAAGRQAGLATLEIEATLRSAFESGRHG